MKPILRMFFASAVLFTSVAVLSSQTSNREQGGAKGMPMMSQMMKDPAMMREMCQRIANDPEAMRMMCGEMMKAPDAMSTMCVEMMSNEHAMRTMCEKMMESREFREICREMLQKHEGAERRR